LLDIDLPGHQVGSANSDIPKGVSPPGDWDRLPVEVQVDQGGHRKNIEKNMENIKTYEKIKANLMLILYLLSIISVKEIGN
jgi:hypothetical protein